MVALPALTSVDNFFRSQGRKSVQQDRSELVELAANIRQRAGLGEPPFSTRIMIDECFPDVYVTGERLPRGVAESVSMGKRGPIIAYNRLLTTAQQRLSIAHAIGHLVFDRDDLRGHCKATPSDERESRAEFFGAELLVPLTMFSDYVRRWRYPRETAMRPAHLNMVDQLASHFHVPQSLIHRRLAALGRYRKHRAIEET